MSLEPDRIEAGPVAVERRVRPWYSKMLGLCFVFFCFEIGIFLLVFPWMDLWARNDLLRIAPWLTGIWDSPFFRGAMSGLGLVNIYISFLELVRLFRAQVDSHT